MLLSESSRRGAIVIGLLLACQTSILAQRDRQLAIDKAIHRGLEYLAGEVGKQQQRGHGWGQVALETYALIVAGMDVESSLIEKNFAYLRSKAKGSTRTYALSCYVLALDAAIAQLEGDKTLLKGGVASGRDMPSVGVKYRSPLKSAVKVLLKTQNDTGGWHYGKDREPPARRGKGKTRVRDKKPEKKESFDNSNTQFAVLALGAGAKRRARVSADAWQRIARHFLRGQDGKGPPGAGGVTFGAGKSRTGVGAGGSEPAQQRGWHYTHRGAATWNMTCAGLSSLILAREQLEGKLDGPTLVKLNRAIRDGLAWTTGTWSPKKSLYGMYSLEKVADLGGVEKFGGRDWYRECSDFLVKSQRPNGRWLGGNAHGEHGNFRVATSFALLVLSRATRLLTIVTGPGATRGDDRSWVVLPTLKTHVHYPTVLKTLRSRPSHKHAGLLRAIVENYPREFRGELVPDLAFTRKAIDSKPIRKILDSRLAEITRVKYDDPQQYLEWHASWKKVADIVAKKERDRAGEVLALYKDPKGSLSLKESAMWALQRLGNREAVPLFVDDLAHEDVQIRRAAYRIIGRLFLGTPPTYDAAGKSAAERLGQVEKVREWVAAQSRKR